MDATMRARLIIGLEAKRKKHKPGTPEHTILGEVIDVLRRPPQVEFEQLSAKAREISE